MPRSVVRYRWRPGPSPETTGTGAVTGAATVVPDGPAGALSARFAAIRAELGIPSRFPPEVEQAAARATAAVVARHDLTRIPFVTLDPPGATDLDQAFHISRRDDGFRVHYAIADVPAFVLPGSPVADEAMRRGQTLYAPDGRTPLHPPVLSEDAASLLPGKERPAIVWRFDLDAGGAVEAVELIRATVLSRRQLDYPQVQAAADAAGPRGPGEADPTAPASVAVLLRAVGERRQEQQRTRGGATLPLPEQEVVRSGDRFALRLEHGLPVEDWNAQLSLMTGVAAASMMLSAGVGVLRTLPPPEPGALAGFRRLAHRVGVDWPAELTYGELMRTLDPADAGHLALLHGAGALFRGARYDPFDGAPPERSSHAAVAAPYAHVTAPLRRLVDRFGLQVCLSVAAGAELPEQVRAGLVALPAAMTASDRLAGELERRCVDAVEAALLAGRAGEVFDAVVVVAGDGDRPARVQLSDPPVLARCPGAAEAGEQVRVRLVSVDPDAGVVAFELVA